MFKLFLALFFTFSSAHCLSEASILSDLAGAEGKKTSLNKASSGAQGDALFNFKSTPAFFDVMNNSHASIKSFIAQTTQFINQYIPGFDITFFFLFVLYTLCFFGVIRSIEHYSKTSKKNRSFTVYTTMSLLVLLVNTVFYGLSEQIIHDKELELSMKSFVFLFSFVAIGKLAISFLCKTPFNFFALHPQKNVKHTVYFTNLLNTFERIAIYLLPALVIALQAADYVQYCFHWADRCDDRIQRIILYTVRILVCGYSTLFYLSIYTTYSKSFYKKITSHPILSTIVVSIITIALSETVNEQGIFVNAFLINSLILLSPLINYPLFCLISNTVKKINNPGFVNEDQLMRKFFRIALTLINFVIALRLIVITDNFSPETIWLKSLSNNLYERFVTISFITAVALLIYYKVLMAAKKISTNQEKRFEKNLYLTQPDSRILTIINAVADLGSIIFWPVYSYLILIELGLNEVYLSSFYGLVVVGALLGGKSSVDDFFKGLSYVLQGVIVRGGKVSINIDNKKILFGVVEKIYLQNFYLRDLEGQLHTMNYSVIKSITFHNEVYSSFVLNIPEDFDINSFNDILNEEKNKFNKSHEDQIEAIDVFNVSKADDNHIKVSYLIKGQPIKVWKAQKLFEKRLGEILKKKKISYTLIPKA